MPRHLFSCGRHGDGKYEAACGHCDAKKRAYWATQKAAAKPTARKTDPDSSHRGVARIHESISDNRAKILALDFARRLNYREISELSGVYPTTCSRVLTTLTEEGGLLRTGQPGDYLYEKPQ